MTGASVIHLCPPQGEATTPCCGCSPVELVHDRITADPRLVTCTGEDRSRPFTAYITPAAPYECDGGHASRHITYAGEHGELEIEICRDPQCARLFARCTHPGAQNRWNRDGTVLTCTFCGRDCT